MTPAVPEKWLTNDPRCLLCDGKRKQKNCVHHAGTRYKQLRRDEHNSSASAFRRKGGTEGRWLATSRAPRESSPGLCSSRNLQSRRQIATENREIRTVRPTKVMSDGLYTDGGFAPIHEMREEADAPEMRLGGDEATSTSSSSLSTTVAAFFFPRVTIPPSLALAESPTTKTSFAASPARLSFSATSASFALVASASFAFSFSASAHRVFQTAC